MCFIELALGLRRLSRQETTRSGRSARRGQDDQAGEAFARHRTGDRVGLVDPMVMLSKAMKFAAPLNIADCAVPLKGTPTAVQSQ